MHSPPDRRFQPSPLPDAPQVRITRVNARTPMNRSEQRVALLIWVGSVCAVLLALSEIVQVVLRTLQAFMG